MNYDDLIFRPRRRSPAASQALLSAALGGLLSLATSCNSDGTPADAATASDTGVTADASAPADAGGMADASAPIDASLAMDAAVIDAATTMDAAALDAATMDAGGALEGGPSLDSGVRDGWCDVDPARTITSTMKVAELSLADFTTMCDGLGGFIEIHPHCGGMNSCRGVSYDSTIGVLTEHTCAGLNTCTGFTCVTG